MVMARLFVLLIGLAAVGPALRTSGILLEVPFVRQQKEGCGSAAMSMVMKYWAEQGAAVDEESAEAAQIHSLLYRPEAGGIYASAMERYLRQNGFRAFQLTAEWADLEHHLSKGRPVIACLQPSKGGPLHYVVVVGLDPEKKAVILNDPARGKQVSEDAARFKKSWKTADRWLLLAVPEQAN